MKNEIELIEKAEQAIAQKKEIVENDYYRLNYHIMPPAGLLNDPNGFIQFEDDYHLFYQFYPFDTVHGAKFWAHLKSKDLVEWQELPLALAPAQAYESHGCYSGSAVNNQGELTLMYTGNVKDQADNRQSYQCLAVTEDGINFNKLGPVINEQPPGYTAHFRDPKVWNKNGSWYMVIGAQNKDEKGRVLLYRSKNLKDWILLGEIVNNKIQNLNDSIYMWECPDLFSLAEKEILIGSPQGINPEGDLYNNIYQSGYFVGKLDYEKAEFEHQEFIELDRGFDFYAPQTTLDNKGRRILIAWMGVPDQAENYLEKNNDWIHALTIPRVLKLNQENKLIQKPVPELKKLRTDKISHQNIKLKNKEIELQGISGQSLELIVGFENVNADNFGLKVRSSYSGREASIISYNQKKEKLTLDMSNLDKVGRGQRSCFIKNSKNLKLHFFIDISSIEIFVNQGEEVFTSRIYPKPESTKIKFFAKNGEVIIRNLKKWQLKKS